MNETLADYFIKLKESFNAGNFPTKAKRFPKGRDAKPPPYVYAPNIARISNVGSDGFEYVLQELESGRNQHRVETAAFIAWIPGVGSANNIGIKIYL